MPGLCRHHASLQTTPASNLNALKRLELGARAQNWPRVRNYARLNPTSTQARPHCEDNAGLDIPHSISPLLVENFTMPPVTPAGLNAYQVNLNRTKTKKWVEAKVQNYDGDDWGVDEYGDGDGDDDDDEPEPTHASSSAMLRPVTHATGSRNSSLPSLQTRRPSPASEIAGRRAHHFSPVSGGSWGRHDAEAMRSSSNSPVHAAQRTVHEGSQSSDAPTSKPASNFRHKKSNSIGNDEGFNVAGRRDSAEYTDGDAGDQRHLSASPQLPDLARMSAFGTDLFPRSSRNYSARKSVGGTLPEDASSSGPNSDNGSAAGRTSSVNPARENTDAPESRRNLHDESGATEVVSPLPPKDNASILHRDVEIHTVAPLRTPSPRAPLHSTRESSLPGAGSFHAAEQPKLGTRSNTTELAPVLRRATFDTAASSPVKDNDLLSDEILKSLGRSATAVETFNGQPTNKNSTPPPEHVGTRDSSSPEASTNISPITEDPDGEGVPTSQPGVSPTNNQAAQWLVPPQSPTLRPRFSWEAEERITHAPAQPEPLPYTDPSTASAGQGVDDIHQNTAAVDPSYMADAENSVSQVPRATAISPQASTSSRQSAARQTAASEAPDSISHDEMENRSASASVHAVAQSSLADQKTPHHTGSNSISSAPLSENPSVLDEQFRSNLNPVVHASSTTATPQLSQAQIMSLRDIMKLSSSTERVAKFNESRDMFASTESGLEDWLVHLSAEHPELAPDGPLSGVQGAQQSSSAPNTAAQADKTNPASQQHAAASSSNTASSPNTRSRRAGSAIPSPASGQIGSKSKEFMQSAGKMGKGLLSKGRSKLRGTGDK
ncbi:hypothetical protein E4U43_004589, partial [Claviceps pusilla]